jgi:hypothetical protein
MTPTKTTTVCANCGEDASGRFCSNCGAALAGSACAACRTPLTPGAQFCHRCGTPVGAAVAAAAPVATRAAGPPESKLPWLVALVAVIGVAALVIVQKVSPDRPALTSEASGAVAGGSAESPMSGAAPAGMPTAGDLSAMSPRERADRLFDRIMRLNEEGKTDSVRFFAPMALASYQMIDQVDADVRYDMGRVAEVSGDLTIARAQADTILATQPTHLLGLVLATRVATLAKDTKAAADFQRRLTSAAASEIQKKLPEYDRHRADIDAALSRKN